MSRRTIRKTRTKNVKRGGARTRKNLLDNVASATYDIKVIMFSEKPVSDKIKMEIYTILKELYGTTVSYEASETPLEWYSFAGVSGLPENLYDKNEVVYTLSIPPDFLKLTVDDYRNNPVVQNNIIDRKLTELENQIRDVLPPYIKLIGGQPGVHTGDWIKHNDKWKHPYIYKVGLRLAR